MGLESGASLVLEAPQFNYFSTLHKIYYRGFIEWKLYRLARYEEALSAAMAPSEQAVTTCLMDLALTSPAAKTPGTVVLM